MSDMAKEHQSMQSAECIYSLLSAQAKTSPQAVAIAAPGRKPLSYEGLMAQITETLSALNHMGLGRNDRVAIVLPNGPEMAVAFLAIASGMTCAPLNPAYRTQEFDFYLSDLGAKAMIIIRGMDSPAIAVAEARGFPIIELTPLMDGEAGRFTLSGRSSDEPKPQEVAQADDIALVLHTSGTTSRPKIVPLTQANLCVSARSICESLALTSADRCLNIMPLFHIHGLIGALLSSLSAGGSAACAPGFVATSFFDWIDELQPTWYTAVPTMHQAILARAETRRDTISRHPLRFIRSCSSPLPPQLMSAMEDAFGVPVVEAYGMTEASHQMACNPLPPRRRKPGSVGIAAGPEVAIMDEDGSPLDAGKTGEIVIRGANVTPGYENNPKANESAFCKGWFRTGDQGYLDEDGYLFITGRIKEIINRAGEKISPREIDEALMDHPAIAQAICFAIPDPQLGEIPGAAVVLKPDIAATEREIREFAATKLADFKVPVRVVILEEIPKGPTGKPQRIGLAEKLGITGENAKPELAQERVAPRSALEEALAGIWSRLLETNSFGITDSFFNLNGDSILATQLLARVHEAFRVQVSLVRFFEEPTIEGLARAINEGQSRDESPAISRRTGEFPTLSFSQERLWFLDQFEPGLPVYHRPTNLRLDGPLDIPTLERALTEIIRRHETLRATFKTADGAPRQVITPPVSILLPVEDLSSYPRSERQSRALQLAVEDAHRPFDLANGPLYRAKLIRLENDSHILLLNIHHIAFDGWSHGVLLREIVALYKAFCEGKPSPLQELPVQYSDYACWQRERIQGKELERQLAYWKRQLDNLPVLELMPDHPRPSAQSYSGARVPIALGPETMEPLKALCREQGVTPFVALLSAFKVLLARYTSQEDVVVGCPVAGRICTEIEPLIGLFSNNLVFRTDLSGQPSFRELLARVQRVSLEAFANQDIPFEKLVHELQPERDMSRLPLFQIALNFRNFAPVDSEAGSLQITPFVFDPGISHFDLSLDVVEEPNQIRGYLEYNTDLFEGDTIHRMADHLYTLIAGILANPDQPISRLPILTEAERRRIIVDWNQTQSSYPRDASVSSLAQAQAQRTPNAIAMSYQGQDVTFGETNLRANRLAHYLRKRGVEHETKVAIYMERSPEFVITLLGILKAGGTCVPIDPGYPADRITYMLEETEALVVVTQRNLRDRLPEHKAQVVSVDKEAEAILRESSENPPDIANGGSLAYIIYTSGSTGRPKGSAIPHRAINRLVVNTNFIRITPDDVIAQASNCSFDGALFEIWGALLNGAKLEWVSRETAMSPVDFAAQIRDRKISAILITTAVFNQIAAQAPGALKTVRSLQFGGEPCDPHWVREVLNNDPPEELLHVYGPTESTTYASWYRVREVPEGATTVPIGKPLCNTTIYILDKNLEPVPVGVPGEICIGGDGVARGYYRRPDLTAERFMRDPFSSDPEALIYRTGDRARFLPDGNIEFLGRLDFQIKIRGFRIEPEEIEQMLTEHPGVREAVVIAREDTPGVRKLVAYVVHPPDHRPEASELRELAKQKLPDFMIPAAYVMMEAFPLNQNGKVDRKALPIPETTSEPERTWTAARDSLELQLAGIWETVLGVRPIGVTDDFFDLGGHSLLAVKLFALIEKHLGRKLPLATLFQAPTIEQMAKLLRQDGWTPPWSSLVPIQPAGDRPPLFFIHGAGGHVLFYRDLARYLGPDQPFYGIQELKLEGNRAAHDRVEEMAEHYIKEIRAFQPKGPYYIGGYSYGGIVAYEVACRLCAQGEKVAILLMVEATNFVRTSLVERIGNHMRWAQKLQGRKRADYLCTVFWHSVIRIPVAIAYRATRTAGARFPEKMRYQRGSYYFRLVSKDYKPGPYPGKIHFFEAEKREKYDQRCSHVPWKKLASGGLELYRVPGDHIHMIEEPHVQTLASRLRECIDRVLEG